MCPGESYLTYLTKKETSLKVFKDKWFKMDNIFKKIYKMIEKLNTDILIREREL